MAESWKYIVEQKRNALKESIPSQWLDANLKDDMIKKGFLNTSDYLDTILPKNEIAITGKTIMELSLLIGKGQLSAYDVTYAFCHRAMLAHQILNCCSEIFVKEALMKAKELDLEFQKNGKTVGILHGIPVSLKDQVDLKGIPSSIGYVSLANVKMKENALLADKLIELGAILFVKTCVPMAMMAPETESNLYPYTYSAANINLSSGGSSGGEGSLIAAGGARIGFGTDIGGSIRIPATYNGLFAMKPSIGRVSYLRVSNSYEAQESIPSVIGPLGKTLEEIEFIMKAVVETKCWLHDPKVLPIEWKENVKFDKDTIKIGVWRDSGNVEPLPPIKRVLNQVSKLLKGDAKLEVVEVEWPEHKRLINALMAVFGADAGKEIIDECAKSGEPIHELLGYLVDSDNLKAPLTINEWWDLCQEVYLIKQKYLKFWDDNQLDAVLAPVMTSPSTKPHSAVCLEYTGVCNLCDSVGVVLPLGTVDATIDVLEERPVRSELEAAIRKQYIPQDFDKMPVCLQVICRKTEEEKCLAISKMILETVKNT